MRLFSPAITEHRDQNWEQKTKQKAEPQLWRSGQQTLAFSRIYSEELHGIQSWRKERPRNAGWFAALWKHGVFYCWVGNQAWIKEVLPQRRMQDLGDVNHLFLSLHRSIQKPSKALIRHSQVQSHLLVCARCVHGMPREAGGTKTQKAL